MKMDKSDQIVEALLKQGKQRTIDSLLESTPKTTQIIEGNGNVQISSNDVANQTIKGNNNIQKSGK